MVDLNTGLPTTATPAFLQPGSVEQDTIESDYWAHLPSDEIGDEVADRGRTMMSALNSNGMLWSWVQRANYYYGYYEPFLFSNFNQGLQKQGDRGQYLGFNVNHFRSILKTLLGLTTVNPPTFDIRAVNSDAASNQLAALGNTILDYYMRHKRVADYLNRAVEHCLIYDAGYILQEWDTNEGREFGGGVDPSYDGDVSVSNVLPIDMIFDPYEQDWNKQDWIIVRQRVPRIQLLTTFPEYADEIKSATNLENDKIRWFRLMSHTVTPEELALSDSVTLYKLFHRKTEYMPAGRYCIVLDDGTTLLDSDLPYDRIPVTRMVADEKIGTCMGRAPSIDLVAPQQALNILNSSILTNQSNFAVQYVAIEAGTDINPRELDKGLVLLEYPAQGKPPQGVNLTSTPAEVFKFRDAIMQDMQMIPGISDVSRGVAQAAGTSGSAMALQSSMTAQNQGILAHNFTSFAGDTATMLLKILRTFANNDRTLTILGKHSSGKTTFSAKDLVDFDRVLADLGNPMTHTFAGRVQVANELLTNGAVDARGYITVLTSGNLDPMTEGPRESANYIRKENEWMMDGVKPLINALDDHHAHVAEHMSIINDSDYRKPGNDPKANTILKLVTDHIMEHLQQLQGAQQAPGAAGQVSGGGQPGAPSQLPGVPQQPQLAPMNGPAPNGAPPGARADQAGLVPMQAGVGAQQPRIPQPPAARPFGGANPQR